MATHTSPASTLRRSGDRRARRHGSPRGLASSAGATRCRKKFLRFFPGGFTDETYLDWERGYKEAAHQRWLAELDRATHRRLLRERAFSEIARRAVTIESRTNLLFSFEKMALRDAVKTPAGAEAFAAGLYELLWSGRRMQTTFEHWCAVVGELPRRQTRVLTWPLVTVFGFLARPDVHFFLKPMVTRLAAEQYGADFRYISRPNWHTYASLLELTEQLRRDLRDLRPRDMIDLQSFLWVQGSSEYD
ncbi:MAG TPA: hypothetical protein VEB21_14850 [Terriglobales bacterium]|nr:hypothetical protein [Terriglobales bacterium]